MPLVGGRLVGKTQLNNNESCVFMCVSFHIVHGRGCTALASLHVNEGEHAYSISRVMCMPALTVYYRFKGMLCALGGTLHDCDLEASDLLFVDVDHIRLHY